MKENFSMIEGLGFHRHDKPARNASEGDPVSPDYSDLTEAGVEHAKQIAREEILASLEVAPEGALLFLGAKSDQKRTGQTMEIWGEALKEITEERNDILVFSKKEIDAERENLQSDEKILDKIKEQIKQHPDKKIVVTYPLFIKQMGYGYKDRWTKKDEGTGMIDKTRYFSEILKKHNNNHAEAIHDWLVNNGTLTLHGGETIQGPAPEDVAKEYLEGLQRLFNFTKKQVPDRVVLVHGVGHQWDLDAVATFLAKGKVSYKDWFETMGKSDSDPSEQVIGEGEGLNDIILDPNTGSTQVVYRGKKFIYKPEIE